MESAFDDTTLDPAPLFDVEERSVMRATPARQREFAFGRSCARAALALHGAGAAAIPVAHDRAPVWPRGFVGSITHCAGFAGAAVARAGVLDAIGFDVEPAVPLDDDLTRLVCTPEEIRSASNAEDTPAGLVHKAFFCAKEAVHKCVAPRSGVMLEFHDVDVKLHLPDGVFSAVLLTRGHARMPDFSRIVGRIAVTREFIAAASFILAAQ